MIDDISSAPIPGHLLYASAIQAGAQKANFPPCLAYAIAWRETISGEVAGEWCARTVEACDGGRGLFQLTSSYPLDWANLDSNISYAFEHFLVPGLDYFAGNGMRGDSLVLCIAAGFNEGDGTAWQDHLAGNVDLGTTNGYASSVLANYHRLIAGKNPE